MDATLTGPPGRPEKGTISVDAIVIHPKRELAHRIQRTLEQIAPNGVKFEWRDSHQDARFDVGFTDFDVVVVDARVSRSVAEISEMADREVSATPGLVVWTPLRFADLVEPVPDIRLAEFVPVSQMNGEQLDNALRHAVDRVSILSAWSSAAGRARRTVERLPAAVYTVSTDPEVSDLYMSPFIETITGYPVDEWKRDPLFGMSIVAPEDSEYLKRAIDESQRSHRPLRVEYRYICADGGIRWVRNVGRVYQDGATGASYWHGVIYDISEHKEIEHELSERERKQAAIADLAHQSLRVRDLGELLQYTVESVAQRLGVEFCKVLELSASGEEFILKSGVGWQEGLVGLERIPAGENSQAGFTLRSDEPVVVSDLRSETRFSGPDLLFDHGIVSGLSVTIHGSEQPYGVLGAHSQLSWNFGADDINFMQSIAGVLGSRIERDARDEELRFHASLLDAVDQAVIATDLHGTVVYWSRAAEDIYGWRRDEVLGRDILDVTPSETSAAQARELMETLRVGESWTGHMWVRRRDGSQFRAEVTNSPIYDRRGNLVGVIGVSVDITERHESAEALREAEERYRSLVEQIPAIVFTADPGDVSSLLYQSPQIESTFGYKPEEWLSDPKFWLNHVHPDDLPTLQASDARANETHEPFTVEYRIFARDGSVIWLRDSARMVYSEDGTPLYWQGVSFDVTEAKEATRTQQLLAAVVASSDDAIFSWSRDGTISSWNHGAENMFGFAADDVVGQQLEGAQAFPASARRDLLALAERAEAGEAVRNFEMELLREDGNEVSIAVTVSPIVDESGRVVGGSAIARDVTDRKKLERQLIHQAFHDPLTGLPNRALYLDRLSQALQRAERQGHDVAVLFIDLDNFKVVNDSLGHARGDELLVAVAERLRSGLRDSDTLARLGGDEFTVLLEDLDDGLWVELVVQRLFRLLDAPFMVGDDEVRVAASIGVALKGEEYQTPDDLVRGADTAMYRAKSQGKGQHALFDEAMHIRALERLQLEQQLRRGIELDELELHYQPFWDVQDARVVGVEALVRWQHSARGLLFPSDFLWIAEETGLIVDLDAWVLRKALCQAQRWIEQYPLADPMKMSVNVSGRQFQQVGFHQTISDVLVEIGLAPENLILEITETDVMADVETATHVLGSLKRLGVQIAIDDFGTGYSSLSHLKRFPIDYVKIDKSFISGMEQNPDDVTLVAGLIRLTQELGMRVVAEGVESEQQLRVLRDLGCDFGQGYLRHKPLAERDVNLVLAGSA